MNVQVRKQYNVICEGKSEVAYLTELSKFFQENDINVSFNTYNANGGQKSNIERCLKEVLKKNKNNVANIFIFLDRDIYILEDKVNMPSANFIGLYYFNTYCFEDFLVLHLDKAKVENWCLETFCLYQRYINKTNDNINMQPSNLLIKNGIFSKYKKGELPPEFEFSFEMLDRLITNCNDITNSFRSDFVDNILTHIEYNEKR